MRLLGAGLFVFVGLMVVGVSMSRAAERWPAWLIAPIMMGTMLTLLIGALVLFNWRSRASLAKESQAIHERFKQLEASGVLQWTAFHATRAFGVEEFEDEGSHYFVELTDGRVLFLSGQYLYDYDPPVFPCTEFSVRRNTIEGYGVDLTCGGAPIALDGMAPAFGEDVWDRRDFSDGQIISNVSYDELKRQQMSRARS